MYLAPDFPVMAGGAAALDDVLAARDARQAAQQALLAAGANCVVSFSVLAPGAVKRSPFLDEVFDIGKGRLKHELGRLNISIYAERLLNHAGGQSLLLAADGAADALKAALIRLEQSHPLGRLWDIDVIDGSGKPLSRPQAGLPPRACLCCDAPAKECARVRRHSTAQLHEAMQQHYRVYLNMVALGGGMRDALVAEAELTPKPGLVDADNQGPHPDMTLPMFRQSAAALAPFLAECAFGGSRFAHEAPGSAMLAAIRPIGLAAEEAMYAATGKVNTHKGALFAFGIAAAALGRRIARQEQSDWPALSADIRAICAGLEPELGQGNTAGARFYRQHGLPGARGEALSGFATLTDFALPAYQQAFAATANRTHALRYVFLTLLAHNGDTNVVKRGGIEALDWLQGRARHILADPAARRQPEALYAALKTLDAQCTEKNLSTGGSADLLALTIWLTEYPNLLGTSYEPT